MTEVVRTFNSILLDMIDNFNCGFVAKQIVKTNMCSDKFINEFKIAINVSRVRRRDSSIFEYNDLHQYLVSDKHIEYAWKYIDVLLELASEYKGKNIQVIN